MTDTPKHEAMDAMGMESQRDEESAPLWMMHVLGPDDIYPAPDHATAVQWCAWLNKRVGPQHGVLCVAVPAIWTGTPQSHAKGLPEAIASWDYDAATTQPAEQSASSPVEGEGVSELEMRAFHAANQAQSVEFYQTLVRDLWKAACNGTELTEDAIERLSTRSVAVSSEAVARLVDPLAWKKFDRLENGGYASHISREQTIAWSGSLQSSLTAAEQILSLLNQARKPEGEPFGYVYQCVDSEKWQFYRSQLKRSDGSIAPGKALYAHPAHEAGEVERLRGIARKLSASISWLDEPFIDANTKEPELRSRIGFMMKDAAEARAALEDK